MSLFLFLSGMVSGVVLAYAAVFVAVVVMVRKENRDKEPQP